MSSLEELKNEVDELKELVARQSKVISRTGEQLLRFQVRQTDRELNSIDVPKVGPDGTVTKQGQIDASDFATNDDIVQLVGELQGQLNILEQRSLRRTINSGLSNDTDLIAPVLNSDGDEPPETIYPKTLKEFRDLSDDSVLSLCHFYELLPPTLEEEAKLRAFMEGKIKSPNVDPSEFKPSSADYSREVLDGLYDDLARFLGLKFRKTEHAW
ncbi:hypothetical protein KL921_000781 [Ogataea angusta]|uniref:Mrp8p n=1 Tax=Pichia angusta TaxID=870730 RepID=A0ABQ7S489_PICAN|nr:hypothetical protein KL921_000781 [Ogataea angusta]KAG7826436.1 hypothetical protein KL909_000488 [Ogataea angusta]KAG7831818.1 hypothetical protein KL920_000153 [Ogataea angusta]KAG7843057.1 hypothetical protein KL942_000153 [Ogataea angusta]KAG7851274.1 hypothetical protein KL941_000943 [Ogataea angusta]